MNQNCTHLDDLLRAEIPLIKRHIMEHKWYQHIQDDNKAMADFIDKYGWILREFYCGYVCKDRQDCELAKQYLPNGNGGKNETQNS